jgi:hypothetical protein
MARRRHHSVTAGGESGSATDLMTCLIGCLILVFIGILLMVFIAQALIKINDTDNAKIVTVTPSNVDGFREDRAFPQGNIQKEPTYLDVHRDSVYIHPNNIRVQQRDVFVSRQPQKRGDLNYDFYPDGELDRLTRLIQENASGEYIVMLVRPGAAKIAERMSTLLKAKGIDVGRELYSTDRKVDHVSKTREYYRLKREAEKADKHFDHVGAGEQADKVNDASPAPAPAPVEPPKQP